MPKKPPFDIVGTPAGKGCAQVFRVLVVARHFNFKTPTLHQLETHYGMSRATAYRWHAAFVAAYCEPPTK